MTLLAFLRLYNAVVSSCPGNGSTLLQMPSWSWSAGVQSPVSRQGHVGEVLLVDNSSKVVLFGGSDERDEEGDILAHDSSGSLLVYDPTRAWTTVTLPHAGPGWRLHAASFGHESRLFVHGGHNGSAVGDMWHAGVANTSEAAWGLCRDATGGSAAPAGRYGHSFLRLPGGDSLSSAALAFGGLGVGLDSAVYVVNITLVNAAPPANASTLANATAAPPAATLECTVSWNAALSPGPQPPPRTFHAAVMLDTCLLVFSGRHPSNPDLLHDDVWESCPRTPRDPWNRSWAQLATDVGTASRPIARFGHTATAMGRDHVLVFGGATVYPAVDLNDLWLFDRRLQVWSLLSPATSNFWPSSRSQHIAVLFEGQLLVHGGMGTYGVLPSTATASVAVPQCELGHGRVRTECVGAFVAACQPCATGMARNASQLQCSNCTTGQFSAAIGVGSCERCSPGHFSTVLGAGSNATCVPCSAGRIAPTAGASNCSQCPAGRSSTAVGSTACVACVAGQFASAGSPSCTKCLAGWMAATSAATLCTTCTAGRFAPFPGETACFDCPGGFESATAASVCVPCAEGSYRLVGPTLVCSRCPAGKYQTSKGQAVCALCTAGTFSSAEGQSSASGCAACSGGTFSEAGSVICTDCAPGKYQDSVAQSGCKGCPVGRYSATVGAKQMALCALCPSGRQTHAAGATSIADCAVGCAPGTALNAATGTKCLPCTVGRFSAGDSPNCDMCPVGKFSASAATLCVNCPAGHFAGPGFGSCISCNAANGSCPVGPNGVACSAHGTCFYGHCTCDAGHSASDCSLVDAGSFCTTCHGVFEFAAGSELLNSTEGQTVTAHLVRTVGARGAVSVTVTRDGVFFRTVSFAEGQAAASFAFTVTDNADPDEGCIVSTLALASVSGNATVGQRSSSRLFVSENDFTSRIVASISGSSIAPASAQVLLGGTAPFVLAVNVTVPVQLPADIVLLYDLSSSFADDLIKIKGVLPHLMSTMQATYGTVRFGISSFIDKPYAGRGKSFDYVYKTDQRLTADAYSVQQKWAELRVGSGADVPEGQLEGLVAVSRRVAEVGWDDASPARRVVVLSTDADYHKAGEFPVAGVIPNDGDGFWEYPEDYPTLSIVRSALLGANIGVVFAVTKNAMATYQNLVDILGFGVVVELTTDSSNLADAVSLAISQLQQELVLLPKSDPFGLVKSIVPPSFTGLVPGSTVEFAVSLSSSNFSAAELRARANGQVGSSVSLVLNAIGLASSAVSVIFNEDSCAAQWTGALAQQAAAVSATATTNNLDWSGFIRPFTEVGQWVLASATLLPGGALSMLPGGSAQHVFVLPHDNLVPLVVKANVKASNVAHGSLKLQAAVLHADGTMGSATSVGFAIGTHDWEPGLGVLYLRKQAKSITLTLAFADAGGAQGTASWDNVGLFPFPVSACSCASGSYARPRYDAGRNKISLAQCIADLPQCTTCVRCAAGHSCGAGLHLKCGKGTFSFGGQAACTPCPAGWVCSGGLGTPCPASTYTLDGVGCLPCEPGYRCRDGVRAPCPPGRFAPALASECPPCRPGAISTAPASPTCTPCAAGESANHGRTACFQCNDGEWSGVGDSCRSCPVGKWRKKGGAVFCVAN